MGITNKYVLFLIVFTSTLATPGRCFAQWRIDSCKLSTFIQQNTDSSIIFYQLSSFSIGRPDYLIISKLGDKVIYSEYFNPYKSYSLKYKLTPGQMTEHFKHQNDVFNKTQPDTNAFFQPKFVEPSKQEVYWEKIIKLNPWKLKDDSELESTNNCNTYISDGNKLIIVLITKHNARLLSFYNPAHYEDCAPGNANRQNILKIETIFNQIFKQYTG